MRIDGRLRDTSWETCLDDLGLRLRSVIDRHGPESVGIFFGTGVGMDATGTRVAEALHAAIGTPAKFSPLTIDGTAKPLISDLVGGFVGLSGRPDYDAVDFMVFVGTNPVISHGHAIAVPNPRPACWSGASMSISESSVSALKKCTSLMTNGFVPGLWGP